MTNPVAVLRKMTYKGVIQSETVMTFCPGCLSMHPFRVKVYVPIPDGHNDVREWDGNLESPTFSPSLLCHHSVHRCPAPHWYECLDPDNCGKQGHAILNDDLDTFIVGTSTPTRRILGHMGPHTVDPGYGNCHSFLKNGIWQFLEDSAHHLAGQFVPMIPLPDFYVKS